MTSTRADFLDRTKEIDKYFDLLTTLDKSNCNLQYTDLNGSDFITPIDAELVKILKANGFILLYNLIESTVLKSIQAIFNKITDSGFRFQELSENLKKLWINNKGSSLKGIESVNVTKIRDIMRDIAESILADQVALLETSCVRINGNIDAQEIRSIAKQLGFSECPDGRHLVTIKTKRNHLAHGDFSFSEIGKDYSVQNLEDFKINAYEYLENLMNEVESFIADKKFTNSPIVKVA